MGEKGVGITVVKFYEFFCYENWIFLLILGSALILYIRLRKLLWVFSKTADLLATIVTNKIIRVFKESNVTYTVALDI